jgi:hypothetical protein
MRLSRPPNPRGLDPAYGGQSQTNRRRGRSRSRTRGSRCDRATDPSVAWPAKTLEGAVKRGKGRVAAVPVADYDEVVTITSVGTRSDRVAESARPRPAGSLLPSRGCEPSNEYLIRAIASGARAGGAPTGRLAKEQKMKPSSDLASLSEGPDVPGCVACPPETRT